ncbi:MAG: hypothetical protein ABMB14_29685, partial [Myxococcota bacterium]
MIPVWFAATASAHVPVVYITSADEDWCAVINGTVGSDIVLLMPGIYTGPCDAEAKLSNQPGEQTTVESFDPLDPAVFTGSTADYVLRATGESLLLVQLEFRDLPPGVDAVRVGDIREFWVRYGWFRNLPGHGIVHDGVVDNLVVTDSEFTDVDRPIDLGCDGGCPIPRFEVSESLFVGGSEALAVGAGTWGTIRENVFGDVAVGIRAGGAVGGELELVGNLVDAVGAGIVLESGPVLVDANI